MLPNLESVTCQPATCETHGDAKVDGEKVSRNIGNAGEKIFGTIEIEYIGILGKGNNTCKGDISHSGAAQGLLESQARAENRQGT